MHLEHDSYSKTMVVLILANGPILDIEVNHKLHQ